MPNTLLKLLMLHKETRLAQNRLTKVTNLNQCVSQKIRILDITAQVEADGRYGGLDRSVLAGRGRGGFVVVVDDADAIGVGESGEVFVDEFEILMVGVEAALSMKIEQDEIADDGGESKKRKARSDVEEKWNDGELSGDGVYGDDEEDAVSFGESSVRDSLVVQEVGREAKVPSLGDVDFGIVEPSKGVAGKTSVEGEVEIAAPVDGDSDDAASDSDGIEARVCVAEDVANPKDGTERITLRVVETRLSQVACIIHLVYDVPSATLPLLLVRESALSSTAYRLVFPNFGKVMKFLMSTVKFSALLISG